MDASAIIAYIQTTFPGVEISENFGYTFFFYRDERKHPFATLASSDNEYDRVSQLDRPGVFRLNIGISKKTFQTLFGTQKTDVSRHDFTVLDQVMPHPVYAAQSFVCVLNPAGATLATVKELLAEAYGLAADRYAKNGASQ